MTFLDFVKLHAPGTKATCKPRDKESNLKLLDKDKQIWCACN